MRDWGVGLVFVIVLAGCGASTDPMRSEGRTTDRSPAVGVPERPSSNVSTSWGPDVGEVHFLDAAFGWAPVARCCDQGQTFVVVYVTDDGGLSWQLRTDKPLAVGDGTKTRVASVPAVRLATKDIGWLVDVEGVLYATRDGARTWEAEPSANPTVGLEALGPSVWRLEQSCPASDARCRYTLLTSDDYGRKWNTGQPQPPIGESGVSSLTPSLVRPSAEAGYILSDMGDYPEANHSGDRPPQEWKPNPILARTGDGGRTWTTTKPPCPAVGEGGPLGADLAASIPEDLWLVCNDEAGSGAMQPKHLHRSSDGGQHWSEDLGTPNPGNGGRTAAASVLRACRAGSRTSIACTRDGGRTWFYPVPNGVDNPRDGGVEVYQFADEHHGWAIAQDIDSGNFNVLWRTTDGGETWSPTRIAS
jgi:hypothetical protein